MKGPDRDIRESIVHNDVTDIARRQTTCGSSTDCDHAASVLHDNSCTAGNNDVYDDCFKSAVTQQLQLDDAVLSHDRNWNRKLINADKEIVLEPVPKINREITVTSLNKSTDSNNNRRRVYNDSTANQLLRQIPAYGKTRAALRYKLRPRGMVTMSRQTSERTRHGLMTTSPTVEVVCMVAGTADSDESNYSGVYERQLEQILDSVVDVSRRRRHAGSSYMTLAVERGLSRSGAQTAHCCTPSSDTDSCCSSDSDSDTDRHLQSHDELDSSDQDATSVVAVDSACNFYRRLRLLLDGSGCPQMAAVEP